MESFHIKYTWECDTLLSEHFSLKISRRRLGHTMWHPALTTAHSQTLSHSNRNQMVNYVTRGAELDYTVMVHPQKKKTNAVALSPRANYTDWATTTCRRNVVSTFVDRGVSRGQRGGSPMVVNLSFLDWWYIHTTQFSCAGKTDESVLS
jgi:hypothetical protein